MKNRNEIESKYKWDLTHVYKKEEDWLKDYNKLMSMVDELDFYKGKLGDKEVLLKFYNYSKTQDILMDKVFLYVYLNHLLNIEDDKYNEMLSKVEILSNEFAIKSAFVLPELNSYDVSYLKSLLNDDRFKLYRMAIEDLINNKKHILSHELEEVVTKVGNFSGTFSEVYDSFDCVDVKFEKAVDCNGEEHEVTNSNFGKLMKSRDRVLRKSAYESMCNAYKGNCNVLANNYIGSVKKDWFFADVYNYKDCLEVKLNSNHLTNDFYYNLINNVNKNLYLNHEWINLKKKIFGLDKVYPYDLSVPISSTNMTFNYEESCDIVLKALSVLGTDYIDAVKHAINNNWIDVYPTKNKDTVGCNVSVYGQHSYTLLNFEGIFSDVSALAHELGHAMHAYFTEQSQPYEYCDTSIFLAEIASTTNEVLLLKHMYKSVKEKDDKLYILQEYISLITGAMFSQVMFSEYEDFAHKLVENKQPITKDILLNKYNELQKKYTGSFVEDMELRKYGCLMVPHFYRAYYVFTYATGITCAFNFARMCDTEDGVKNVRKFLSSGLSDYPLNILKNCGIDLETDKPYEILFEEMQWALNEIKSLI